MNSKEMISEPFPAVHSRYFHQRDWGRWPEEAYWRKLLPSWRSWSPSASKRSWCLSKWRKRLHWFKNGPSWIDLESLFMPWWIRLALNDSWNPNFLSIFVLDFKVFLDRRSDQRGWGSFSENPIAAFFIDLPECSWLSPHFLETYFLFAMFGHWAKVF